MMQSFTEDIFILPLCNSSSSLRSPSFKSSLHLKFSHCFSSSFCYLKILPVHLTSFIVFCFVYFTFLFLFPCLFLIFLFSCNPFPESPVLEAWRASSAKNVILLNCVKTAILQLEFHFGLEGEAARSQIYKLLLTHVPQHMTITWFMHP